ncbi:MAG TPA: hypothetical protein VL202_11055 [Pararhizobium sp.]|uniref:hypothetical protein n=1 Tax=Pararhizobium sp. TaxID=1977563 RepID=UPI002C01E5F3|nr:hypothetical protein [Pararhizobium sp.]HTO31699.1 hypothetical protein [Pararhizobium sp.]
MPLAPRLLLLLATSPVMASHVHAQEKFLDGAYGNKDGCAYANSNDAMGSEDFFLLTDEAVTSAASYCGFKGPLTRKGDSFATAVTCAEEGEGGEMDTKLEIQRTGKDYRIVFEDGMQWGPLKKCK